MITLEGKIGIAAKLIRKSMELKESGGHDVFIEWFPHVDWMTIRAFIGPWSQTKTVKEFTLKFNYVSSVQETYKEIMEYLDNMGKTSETEAQNG